MLDLQQETNSRENLRSHPEEPGHNKARSVLTALAVVALVAIFSMIMVVLMLLDDVVAGKAKDIKLAISHRSNEVQRA
jgi:hypothetical protein